ncbi:MAG: hypothetical protein JRJ85_11340 [Deltaproteobacteria bacterium]|nr:hypothetical protein [Deltaproteobacteria bacterium]
MKLLIGNDPEVFVKKDGVLVSAYGLIEGDKEHPQLVRNGMVQVDGMALEFGIDPAATEEQFIFRIEDVMGQLKAMIPGYELDISPVAHFGEEMIQAQPEKAKELGCSPDFSAYTGGENHPPNAELPFRTAAGHIHIGWTEGEKIESKQHIDMVEALVKQLDFFLALPSLLFDEDKQRREMYGAAGCYRPKSYGCEYRTLSNKWLGSRDTMSLVYNNTKLALDKLKKGDILSDRWDNLEHIINNSDINEARYIMEAEGIPYV